VGKKRKFSESFVYVLIVAFIINSLATGIIGYNIDEIISNKLSINSQLSTIISDYLVYTIPLIIILLIAMSIKRNRYMLNKFSIKNNKLLLGVGIGLLMNSFCVLVAYIHKDITLTWNYINIILLLFCFLAVLIQCLAEEMLNRIFIFEKIKKS
jgi:membrane protease YdiL (CAAX protease family)